MIHCIEDGRSFSTPVSCHPSCRGESRSRSTQVGGGVTKLLEILRRLGNDAAKQPEDDASDGSIPISHIKVHFV